MWVTWPVSLVEGANRRLTLVDTQVPIAYSSASKKGRLITDFLQLKPSPHR
jgi:hypothetical protein